MAVILKGEPVAQAIDRRTVDAVRALRAAPTLAILRVGQRADDMSYEKAAMKRCAMTGVKVRSVALPADVDSDGFFEALELLNGDDGVHGILMFRPLPGHIDGERARKSIRLQKDVDGCTDGSLGGVFANTPLGFAPCTAQAVVEMLEYYGLDCAGKRAAVIGRSLVVGRPVAMLLMHRNATVTVCHTGTKDTPEIVRAADIVVACSGRTETLGAEYFRPGQAVIDVGIGWSAEKQRLCGDVIFDEAEPVVAAISPVPGGVGSVTASVLAAHVAEAARQAI